MSESSSDPHNVFTPDPPAPLEPERTYDQGYDDGWAARGTMQENALRESRQTGFQEGYETGVKSGLRIAQELSLFPQTK